MPFKKGQRHPNQGGPRERSGRPTREKAREKQIETQTADEVIKKNGVKLANTYIARALSGKSDRVLTHAIERLVPAAKQQLEISGGLKIVKVDAFDPSKVK